MKLFSVQQRFKTNSKFMRSLNIVLMLVFSYLGIFAQSNEQLVKDIHFYADIVANAMDTEHKIRANEALVPLVEKALEENIEIDFKKNKFISDIISPDSLFSIITWPIQTSESSHSYAGYILHQGNVIKLNDQATNMLDNIDYVIGDADNWFGQLYYSIKQFEEKEQMKYVLFGINAFTQYEDIKMADIMYFDENGGVVFGQQLFAKDMKDLRDAKNRIILKYSDDAPVNLNYNSGLKMIVYDHLIPRMGQISGQGIILTGDGSYEGYSLNEGIWIHKEKLFDQIYDEAPRPTPVFDDEKSGRDIFGKPKGKN